MGQVMGDIYLRFPFFLLVGLRVTGIFIMSPIFGRKNIPSTLKVAFALILSYILIIILPIDTDIEEFNVYSYSLDCTKEFLLGLTIGYLTTLFFSVVLTAGQMIDAQIGFGMVNIFDPHSNLQIPLLGNFLNVLALIIFFTVDGHHVLISLLVSSFYIIPPGMLEINPLLGMVITEFFAVTFVLAVRIAIPVFAAALMAETALAIIMRAVPQMNVFVVGMPLKIILGMVVLIALLPMYRMLMIGVFDQMNAAIIKTFEGFAQ